MNASLRRTMARTLAALLVPMLLATSSAWAAGSPDKGRTKPPLGYGTSAKKVKQVPSDSGPRVPKKPAADPIDKLMKPPR